MGQRASRPSGYTAFGGQEERGRKYWERQDDNETARWETHAHNCEVTGYLKGRGGLLSFRRSTETQQHEGHDMFPQPSRIFGFCISCRLG